MTKKNSIVRDISNEPLPLVIPISDRIDYLFSYAQDSPFFKGLSEKKLLGTKCEKCSCTYATPRTYCRICGCRCNWVELPQTGIVHTFTTCHYTTYASKGKTPYHLVLVELSGLETFFLSQLKGIKEEKIKIGMKVQARFRKRPRFNASDIWIIPAK